MFDSREVIGGQLAVAAAAPHRTGWRALLDFYAHGLAGVELRLGTAVGADDLAGFDEVVLAVGATEVLPDLPGIERALPSSQAIGQRLRGRSLLVVDDGFGWWPCASAVELGVRAGFETITVATPGAGFGASLPPEGRVQLLARLRGAPLRGAPADGARPPRRRLGASCATRSPAAPTPSPPTPSSSSASASRATGARSSRPRAGSA